MLDSEEFTVTYTEVSSPFEDLSDIGSSGVVVYGYDGLPMHPPSPKYVLRPEHPPSPDYMSSPKHPPSPVYVSYVPKPAYPEFMLHVDDVLPAEEQPLPAFVLPTANSPGYITESDLEEDLEEDDEDPEEDPAYYPTDRDDDEEEESFRDDVDDEEEDEDEDDDEEEEEEHLASADSIPPPVYYTTARMSIRAQTSIPLPSEIEVARLLAIPTLPPSPLTSYSSPLPQIPYPPLPTGPTHPLGCRAAMIWLRADSPSTSHLLPLPPPIGYYLFYLYQYLHHHHLFFYPLLTVKQMFLRLCYHLKRGCALLSPTARHIGGFRAYYGFVGTLDSEIRHDLDRELGYRITDVWEDSDEITKEIPTTDVAGLSQRMTDFVTTVRQDTDEIYGRLDDTHDDRLLMSGKLNSLRRDRHSHARTARLMESEAKDSYEAWVQSMYVNDTTRSEKMASKRTTRSSPAITTTTTTPVTNAHLKALIDQGVADALAERDADRSRNGEDSHDSKMGVRRQAPLAQIVFRISSCTVENQIKFATCTLLGSALTWWNSHVKTVGHDVAYAMTWKNLKKKITNKYCLRCEIKKLEVEMWNIKVKGTDVVSYNQRFQEMALMCAKKFPEESDKIERYVGGLPDMIHGSVMASKPNTMQDVVEFAKNTDVPMCKTWMMVCPSLSITTDWVEKLIKELHSVPVDGSNGDLHTGEKSHLSNGVSKQHSKNGTDLRETQSMLLERIASEMNRLKFYFAHAKRIQNASSLLDTSLGHCFVDGLTHKDENAVFNCLRAYAAVDNTRNAEDIFRSTVVAPLVQKVIPYSSSGVVSGSAGDELEEDYKQIKHLIDEDCKFLLQISSTENSGFHVFSFLANSILKEVLWAIQHGKPGAFSPGRPTEFLKNYKSSLGFLADLEGYCPSRSAVANFRAEAVYVDFMKQWNIGVYFSLRFQEIAGSLDSALVGSKLTPVQKSDSEHGLTLKQSLTLLECLKSCWREDVLLISISDKFLRLTLQLISRYVNWLSAGLSARKTRNAGSNSPFEWAVSAAPDDLIYVIHDLNHLAADVCGDFIGHVFEILKSYSTEVVDLVKGSILQGGISLKDLVPSVIESIIDTLAEKCNEEVQQLQGIVAAYRMTKKPPPVRHSHYVSGVLRPLK
nr:conserved oligomeric Golgi complex subunit 2 [Tanacetum cinerariifolium]